mmetsp:Transcript_35382/g.101643  ORF Transcript_35382/g.101643 Transcript_35382/m.101643 type:complete len:291 (+) Transcript_35382:304-1176(+)
MVIVRLDQQPPPGSCAERLDVRPSRKSPMRGWLHGHNRTLVRPSACNDVVLRRHPGPGGGGGHGTMERRLRQQQFPDAQPAGLPARRGRLDHHVEPLFPVGHPLAVPLLDHHEPRVLRDGPAVVEPHARVEAEVAGAADGPRDLPAPLYEDQLVRGGPAPHELRLRVQVPAMHDVRVLLRRRDGGAEEPLRAAELVAHLRLQEALVGGLRMVHGLDHTPHLFVDLMAIVQQRGQLLELLRGVLVNLLFCGHHPLPILVPPGAVVTCNMLPSLPRRQVEVDLKGWEHLGVR